MCSLLQEGQRKKPRLHSCSGIDAREEKKFLIFVDGVILDESFLGRHCRLAAAGHCLAKPSGKRSLEIHSCQRSFSRRRSRRSDARVEDGARVSRAHLHTAALG